MLSSPPARFAAGTSASRPPRRGRRGARAGSPRSSSPSTMSDSPSEQIRKTSPDSRDDRERVDVDVRVGAERAGDHRALRVHLGRLGRQLAAPDELRDERVVVRQLLEVVVAQQVGARVADVAERDGAVVLDERDGHRRPHAGGRRHRSTRARARAGSPPGSAARRDPLAAAAAFGLVRARPRRAPRPPRRPGRRPSRPRPRRAAAAKTYAVLVVAALAARCPSAPARWPIRRLTARTSGRSRRPGRRRRERAAVARQADAVHERAVRRADVLAPRRRRGAARSARAGPTRTRPRGSGTSLLPAAAHRQRMRRRAETTSPSRERRARQHDQPAELARHRVRDEPGGRSLLRPQDHRLLRQSQVARRRADDPPDEEVEQDEERDLEDEKGASRPARRRRSCGLPRERDLRRADREARPVLELQALHPLAAHLDAVRRVEVDEPVRLALLPQLGVTARDVRVDDLDVGVLRAAEDDAGAIDLVALAVPRAGRRSPARSGRPARRRRSAAGPARPQACRSSCGSSRARLARCPASAPGASRSRRRRRRGRRPSRATPGVGSAARSSRGARARRGSRPSSPHSWRS